MGALLLPTLAVMLLMRDDLRRLALRQAGLDTPVPVAAQWGPFAVFAVCLVAAVVTIGWMVTGARAGPARRRRLRCGEATDDRW